MVEKIYPLVCAPGIQKDGTDFSSNSWVDAQWVRFVNGNAKSIGGYKMLMPAEPVENTSSLGNYIFRGNISYKPRKMIVVSSIDNNSNWYCFVGCDVKKVKIVKAEGVVEESRHTCYCFVYNPDTGFMTNLPGEQLNLIDAWDIVNEKLTDGVIEASMGLEVGWSMEVMNGAIYASRATKKDTPPSATLLFGVPLYNLAAINSTYPSPVMFLNFGAGSGQLVGGTDYGGLKFLSLTNTYPSDGQKETLVPKEDRVYCTGGVLAVPPYLFFLNYAPYDSDFDVAGGKGAPVVQNGTIAYTHQSISVNNPNKDDDYIIVGDSIIKDWGIEIANTPIIAGKKVRGGANSPSALFWSLNSLTRAYFIGEPNIDFGFELVGECSILSSNSIVEDKGIFYWAGIDCFYSYNGTIQSLPNPFNLQYFFNNVDMAKRQKVWGCSVSKYNEIWWHYPNKNLPGYGLNNQCECNAAIIYNTAENIWYDTAFPETTRETDLCAGRSCGVSSTLSQFPIWADSYSSSRNVLTPTYNLWFHEKGSDEQYLTVSKINPRITSKALVRNSIPTYLTTNPYSFIGFGPDKNWNGNNKFIEVVGFESDIQKFGDIDLQIKSTSYIGDVPELNMATDEKSPYILYARDDFAVTQSTEVKKKGTVRWEEEKWILENAGDVPINGNCKTPQGEVPLIARFAIPQRIFVKGENEVLPKDPVLYIEIKGNTSTQKDQTELIPWPPLGPVLSPIAYSKHIYYTITKVSYVYLTDGLMSLSIGKDIPRKEDLNALGKIGLRKRNFYIDLRENDRFMTLNFSQNKIGGNFQFGKSILHTREGSTK